RRINDVRADDRGELDLYRHAGDSPGDLRDVCGGSAAALWWRLERETRRYRRHGRHGWRPAAGRDDEWWSVSGDRCGPGADQAAGEDGVLRCDGHIAG